MVAVALSLRLSLLLSKSRAALFSHGPVVNWRLLSINQRPNIGNFPWEIDFAQSTLRAAVITHSLNSLFGWATEEPPGSPAARPARSIRNLRRYACLDSQPSVASSGGGRIWPRCSDLPSELMWIHLIRTVGGLKLGRLKRSDEDALFPRCRTRGFAAAESNQLSLQERVIRVMPASNARSIPGPRS